MKSHIEKFQSEIEKVAELKNDDWFYNWFNESGGDKEANFLKGSVDFNYFFLSNIIGKMKNLQDKNCLEIGYGGGRLVASASKYFKKVIGVDIHNERCKVMEELKQQGVKNVDLLITDGESLPIKDNSIDFVYSFIVFQHMEKLKTLIANLTEIRRVLKDDGLALIYFGRYGFFSIGKSSRFRYSLDKLLETFSKGYRERANQKVNGTDLTVTLKYIITLCDAMGFKVVGKYISKTNDFYPKFAGQYGLLLRKK